MAPILATLWVFACVGVLVALHIARRVGRLLNFRTLLILNYVLVSVVSGIVHLSNVEGAARGFFDVLGAGQSALTTATLGAVLGLLALCIGCFWRLDRTPSMEHPRLRRADRWILVIVLVATAPFALSALARMQQIAAVSDAVRVLTVDQGAARFVFMSHWAVWGISFAALLLMSFRPFRGTFWSALITLGGVVLVAATLSWTGGRSIIIVMALPLLLVAAYRFRRTYWLSIPVGVVAAAVYIVSITQERTAGARTGSSLATWADWEWGRFSMSGFADAFVAQNGYLNGETFYAAGANVVLGLVRLAGIYVPNPEARAMPQITGETLLGNTNTYVVAGLNAELYVNFGLVGIVVGLLLLGVFAGYVDRKFAASSNLLTQFAWGYLGVLIVFRTLAADANAIGSFFIYSGLPVLVVALLAAATQKRPRRDTKPRRGRNALKEPARTREAVYE